MALSKPVCGGDETPALGSGDGRYIGTRAVRVFYTTIGQASTDARPRRQRLDIIKCAIRNVSLKAGPSGDENCVVYLPS